MVGLEKAARLAHRMEDLLDTLPSLGLRPTGDVLELLSSAVRELRSLTGDSLASGTAGLHPLFERFSEVLAKKDNASPVEKKAAADDRSDSGINSPAGSNVTVEDLTSGQQFGDLGISAVIAMISASIFVALGYMSRCSTLAWP